MKNDANILSLLKDIQEKSQDILDFFNSCGNLCASTDRMIETIIDKAKKLEQLHKDNFE